MKQLLFCLVCFLFTQAGWSQDDYNRSLFVGGLAIKGGCNPIKGATVGLHVADEHMILGLEGEWMEVPPTTEENPFVYYYPFRMGVFALLQMGPVVAGMGALTHSEVYVEAGLHQKFLKVFSVQATWRASLANSPELNGVSLRLNYHFFRRQID